MTKYIPCPHCGSLNREIDNTCYQCGKTIAGSSPDSSLSIQLKSSRGGPIPPPPETMLPNSRYKVERVDRDSTVVHGLMSGALAGVTTGAMYGIINAIFASMFASIAMESIVGLGSVGVIIFFITLFLYAIYGTILGAILGAMNMLCYQADCLKFGSYAGVLISIINCLFGFGCFFGITIGISSGAILGYLASYIERHIFRKQYAEL